MRLVYEREVVGVNRFEVRVVGGELTKMTEVALIVEH